MNKCEQWVARLREVMPFGSSTCSKAAQFMPDEPGVIARGEGCRVWDADGREFIDFRNSLGPVTLGYRFPAVDEAIRAQLDTGIIFGHPHPLECEVAELIREVIPCAEQARFLKTGGEAVAACIKLARAFTGRDHVIQIGYNGWLNSLAPRTSVLPGREASSTPPGVPRALSVLHHACRWNDLPAIEKVFAECPDQVAAVIVSADCADIEQGAAFYPALRELTQQNGALLICDEIVTGFRVAIGGIHEHFNFMPDMAVFAKGIANGMPLSVYCGRRDVMQTAAKAVISSTYGGETLSLAAARAAITTYKEADVIAHLWRQGEKLWGGLNRLFEQRQIPAAMKGFWPCAALTTAPDAPTDLRENFLRSCYRNGLSMYHVGYVNFSHTDEDVAEALQRFETVCREIA